MKKISSQSKKSTSKTSKKRTKKNQKKQSFKIWSLFLFVTLAIFSGSSLFVIEHVLQGHHLSITHPRVLFNRLKIKISQSMIFSAQKAPEAFQTVAPAVVQNQSIDYVEYQALSKAITLDNKDRIRKFIVTNPESPLGITLRNNWLLFLAQRDDWSDFLIDYRPTNQEEVECYHLIALNNTGDTTLALSGVKRLWDANYKVTGACQALFEYWIQNASDFPSTDVWKRLQQAIHENDKASVLSLIKILPANEQSLAHKWIQLYNNPEELPQITLPQNDVGKMICLDIVTKWATIHVESAIRYWNLLQKQMTFDELSTQQFYLTASLHLALQGDPTAEQWFAKILPAYSTNESRAWQVRFALMHQNWSDVLTRIASMTSEEQEENMWQYWKARALAKMHRVAEAQIIYSHLSNQRQYYGFLAAYQDHTALAVQQVNYDQNAALLAPYQQQIDQIKTLYTAKQLAQALPLTRDLLNQLDPIGQYTLAYLFHGWGWDSEAMMIVNKTPFQDDLMLRFPMPHQTLITTLCTNTNISPAFIYSLARQESNFYSDVASQAGGIGILQLTLATAQQFDPTITQEVLYRPEININISILYLKRLMKQFDGHPLLVAAAYNAGPQTARLWQPRQMAMPADIWIETRPWGETRNYLKNTLAYAAVYQYLLGSVPDISAFMQNIPVNINARPAS